MKLIATYLLLGSASADVFLKRSWRTLNPDDKKLANNIWSHGHNQGTPPTQKLTVKPEFSGQSFHVSFDLFLRENYESALWRPVFTIGTEITSQDPDFQYPRLGSFCASTNQICSGCTTGIYWGRKGHFSYIDMREAGENNQFLCSVDNPLIAELTDPLPGEKYKECVCAGSQYTETASDRFSLYFSANNKWADRSRDWDLSLVQSCNYNAPWEAELITNYQTNWKTGEKHHVQIFYDSSHDGRVRVYLDGEQAIGEATLNCPTKKASPGNFFSTFTSSQSEDFENNEMKECHKQMWIGSTYANTWREGLAGADLGNFMYNDEGTNNYEEGCMVKKPSLLEVVGEEIEDALVVQEVAPEGDNLATGYFNLY